LPASHITEAEFEALFFSDASQGQQGSTLAAKVSTHCRECSQCAKLKDRYISANQITRLIRNINIHGANNCPPEGVWLEVVAGILEDDQAMKLLSHASRCRSCAPLLTLAQDFPLDENVKVPLPLKGSSSEWQLSVAKQMAARCAVSPQLSPVSRKWAIVSWAAASLVAAGLLIAAFLKFIPGRTESNIGQLLAQAYQQHRTVEFRIAGASHSQLHQRRSAGQESIRDSMAYLREPERAINSVCKAQPDGAKCLLYQAQLDLLDWRFEPALVNLNRIVPQSRSEEVLLTRALALSEKGEIESESGAGNSSYAEAIADLTDVLKQDSRNPVALFNRALIYQKLDLLENSLADWRMLLDVESDPGWRAEAKQNLDLVEEKKKREL
jgi:hypothetical protein